MIHDTEGVDLAVLSGTQSDDPVSVHVAMEQDGPYVEVATGTGDIHVDIEGAGFPSVRFVRIIDQGTGEFNAPFAGYDLDSVVNLSRIQQEEAKLWAITGGQACSALPGAPHEHGGFLVDLLLILK